MLLEEANEKRVIEIGYELALALDYLHNDLNISHGDLKLSIVLVKKSSIVNFYLNVEIMRFRLLTKT